MITGEIKAKVDAIWNAFWSGGIANPLEVIEHASEETQVTIVPVGSGETDRKGVIAAGGVAGEQYELPHDVVERRAHVVHVVAKDGTEPVRRFLQRMPVHDEVLGF